MSGTVSNPQTLPVSHTIVALATQRRAQTLAPRHYYVPAPYYWGPPPYYWHPYAHYRGRYWGRYWGGPWCW